MKRNSRLTGLIVAFLGMLVLFNNLRNPRVSVLHGADILGLVACGFSFGIAFVGLIGKLKLSDDS